MSTVVRGLREDHWNIGRLLGMLERQLDAMDTGSDFDGDYDLMRDIMTYMVRFPDHTHHPKEDLMFERMRAHPLAPDTERTIENLLVEHGALARKGETFHEALRRAAVGAKSDRQALLSMGRDYVEFLRAHARLEEETVFIEAETLLGDADWSEIAQAFEAHTDPVFGSVVDREFRALYQHIQNSAYLKARQ